ncbi:MAG TPA: hypothetical protein VIO61_02765 [Anaerolineaceae bacterium]
MISTTTFAQSMPVYSQRSHTSRSGLGRLLTAAVVNRQFCSLLLQNPELALRNGYQGEKFNLTHEERTVLLSIHANSLTDLAGQLNRFLRA